MKQDEEERPSRARRWARWRDRLRDRRKVDFVYRIVVGVVGLVVFAVGIIAIPYPGPGWAIVFIGLGILATEFEWARRLLAYAKERYDKVMDWFQAQTLVGPGPRRHLHSADRRRARCGCSARLDWTAELFGFDWPWLKSPIGLGS